MANAEMKIFEAEKLHQPMIAAVNIIPIMPLEMTKGSRKLSLIILTIICKKSIYTAFFVLMWNYKNIPQKIHCPTH